MTTRKQRRFKRARRLNQQPWRKWKSPLRFKRG